MEYYYQLLGVRNNATSDEIKQAYRKKAKLYHPDINPSPQAKEMFIKIQDAYDILLNGKPLPRTISYPTSQPSPTRTQTTYQNSTGKAHTTGMGREEYRKSKQYKKDRKNYKQEIFDEVATNLIVSGFVSVLAGVFGGLLTLVGVFTLINVILLPKWLPVIGPISKFSKQEFNVCLERYKDVRWIYYLSIPIVFFTFLRALYFDITIFEITFAYLFVILILVLYSYAKLDKINFHFLTIGTLISGTIYLYLRTCW